LREEKNPPRRKSRTSDARNKSREADHNFFAPTSAGRSLRLAYRRQAFASKNRII